MDIDIGFGKVLRVRWLKAKPERRHIFRPHVETLSEKKVRHDKALALLERRRLMRLEGLDVADLERQIKGLGFAWEDELSVPDGRYSYWRRR